MIVEILLVLVPVLAASFSFLMSRRRAHRSVRYGSDLLISTRKGTTALTAAIQQLLVVEIRSKAPKRVAVHVPRPSLSRWLVQGAVRRLPAELGEAEKARWAEEMKADVASVPGRLRRLRYAFGIWRKGAPRMPAAGHHAPRSAD